MVFLEKKLSGINSRMNMKKLFITMMAVVAMCFISCQNNDVEELTVTKNIPISFNIEVGQKAGFGSADTRAIKTAWEEGDIIDILLDDSLHFSSSTKFDADITLSFDGTKWNVASTSSAETFLNNKLGKSGTLFAYYTPSIEHAFNLRDGSIVHESYAVMLHSGAVNYTVSEGGVVSAQVALSLPEGAIQVLVTNVPDNYSAYQAGGRFVDETYFVNSSFVEYVSCFQAASGARTNDGIYFYGVLKGHGNGIGFTFYPKSGGVEYYNKYYSKTLSAGQAIKIDFDILKNN